MGDDDRMDAIALRLIAADVGAMSGATGCVGVGVEGRG